MADAVLRLYDKADGVVGFETYMDPTPETPADLTDALKLFALMQNMLPRIYRKLKEEEKRHAG